MSERFSQPPAGHRDWYAFEAIRALPRILLMVDKNPFSSTYGCFDREFWHYRTIDFPCGMSQEFCLPLALAYEHPFPGNPYYRNERLRELVIGSIEFAKNWSHADSSCDDYFPFERALGAHVFSTYAMAESYRVLGLRRPDLLEFLRARGHWLVKHNESGQLANHQALAALALYTVFELTGDPALRKASDDFRDITLSWQNEEGWFQEYEGADPGYHSCSIAFLAKLWQKSRDESLVAPVGRAIEFASYFMHPDGSYAGEYGSRNTYHFYPHGFEVFADRFPLAGRVAQTYLQRALPERRRYFNDDNRMCAHYVYDWMHAWLDWQGDHRDGTLEDHRGPFTKWFPNCKLFVKKTPRYYAVLAMNKGGVLKVYDQDGPLYSDTGPILKTKDDDVLVSHLVDDHSCEADPAAGRFSTKGRFSKRKHQLPSPVKQAAFRAMNLTLGRYNPNLVRTTLQKILITGKPRTEVAFARQIEFTDDAITVRDRVDATGCDLQFARMAIGSDATSIYVANSTNFQESMLLPWVELSNFAPTLNEQRVVELPPRVVDRAHQGYALGKPTG
ncbi:MAG: hypothetical protein IPK74_19010 [Deltaproteobacteria bacterium]|nr:hypothetical protein [Deltaproteobacteria bacterium]